MRMPRVVLLLVAAVVLIGTLTVVTWEKSAQASSIPITTISLNQSHSYTPKAPAGATDDYHCTLLNPHVTQSSYIIGSQFFPGSTEDHHAILFLVPPNLAAEAEADNVNGQGWSCFGETPIPNTGLAQIRATVPTACPREAASCCRPAAWWSCRSTTTCWSGTSR
jgi:hypothetical protein